MLTETIFTVVMMSALTTKANAKPYQLPELTGAGSRREYKPLELDLDNLNEVTSSRTFVVQSSRLGVDERSRTGQNDADDNPNSSSNIDFLAYDKDILAKRQFLKSPQISNSMKTKQKLEDNSKSRINHLRFVADSLVKIAESSGEELTETTQPFATSSNNGYKTSAKVSKRRHRNYYGCDTTRLTIQSVIEYIRTGKICGYKVHHMRFGLGR